MWVNSLQAYRNIWIVPEQTYNSPKGISLHALHLLQLSDKCMYQGYSWEIQRRWLPKHGSPTATHVLQGRPQLLDLTVGLHRQYHCLGSHAAGLLMFRARIESSAGDNLGWVKLRTSNGVSKPGTSKAQFLISWWFFFLMITQIWIFDSMK